jgi:hypothetical protein
VGNDCLLVACWDGAVRIQSCQCRPELELLDSLTTLQRSPLVSLTVHWPDVENGSRGQEDAVVVAGAANGMLACLEGPARRELAFVANHGHQWHLLLRHSRRALELCAQQFLVEATKNGEGNGEGATREREQRGVG